MKNGTTTAAYYGTIHLEGTKILVDVVNDKGQRAIIGKVNQLRNCPEYYKENSVEESLTDTEEFIKYVQNIEVFHLKKQLYMKLIIIFLRIHWCCQPLRHDWHLLALRIS